MSRIAWETQIKYKMRVAQTAKRDKLKDSIMKISMSEKERKNVYVSERCERNRIMT